MLTLYYRDVGRVFAPASRRPSYLSYGQTDVGIENEFCDGI